MSRSSFPAFYQIVDHVDWLEQFLPQGLSATQLRIKEKPLSEVRAQLRSAKLLCDEYNCQLIVNDYWKLALDEGCDYVHLGQEDLQKAELSILKQAGVRLGISTHSQHELEVALAAEPDYVALGPIYPTILKKMPCQPQGLETIKTWKQQIGDIPLIAIGGLTIERAAKVYAAGADSICVVTDVLLNEQPGERLAAWLAIAGQTAVS